MDESWITATPESLAGPPLLLPSLSGSGASIGCGPCPAYPNQLVSAASGPILSEAWRIALAAFVVAIFMGFFFPWLFRWADKHPKTRLGQWLQAEGKSHPDAATIATSSHDLIELVPPLPSSSAPIDGPITLATLSELVRYQEHRIFRRLLQAKQDFLDHLNGTGTAVAKAVLGDGEVREAILAIFREGVATSSELGQEGNEVIVSQLANQDAVEREQQEKKQKKKKKKARARKNKSRRQNV